MDTPTPVTPKGVTAPPPPVMAAKPAGAPPVPKAAGPGGPGQPQLAGLLPGEQPSDIDDQNEFHHASGFFNQPWVQNILPFATSLMFHLAIIGIGFALYKTVQAIQNPNKEQQVIPESKTLGATKMPGGTEHPGPMADPTKDLAQDEVKNPPTDDGLNTHASDKLTQDTEGKGNKDNAFGIGNNANAGHGHGSGFSNGGGGSPAPYGTPGGGDGHIGPKSNVFGTGGNADKVVFLVDTSGSMIGIFGEVKAELKRSILALPFGRGQYVSFDIVTFSDEAQPKVFSKTIGGKAELQIDTPDIKKKASDFIDDMVASGGTIPMPAIKQALSLTPKPQLLYVMTDGFDNVASFDDVIDAFKKGSADGVTHVNCIQFVAEEDKKLQDVLETIVKNGHGQFKQIKKSDMQ